jgi:signal transduction histidine kinase
MMVRTLEVSGSAGSANTAGTAGTDAVPLAPLEAERRFAFLAEASALLASSLDYQETLQRVAGLAVPTLADHCIVDMVTEEGALRRVAVAVADPAKEAAAQALRRYPPDMNKPRGVPRVLRAGQPVFHPALSEDLLESVAHDAEHLRLLHELEFKSAMLVPLVAHGNTLGAITFVYGPSGRRYSATDLTLGDDLAAHCALAIENARLYEAERDGRERLHALSRRLVEVQESERRHIARELHDEIGQTLTGLKLLLEMAVRPPAAPTGPRGRGNGAADAARLAETLGEARSLVADLMGRVRALSLELRPTMLDDLGLLPTVLWHIERYTGQTGIGVGFQHSGIDRRFPAEVETAAYRIVQEALTNVARYAGVTDVAVRCWLDQEHLCVQVEDKGAGFDPETALAAGATSGLAGMRERASLLGGTLSIESAPGAGTRVRADLPLVPADGPLKIGPGAALA